MNKEKLIKWLCTTCEALDGLASSSDDDKYYAGSLAILESLLLIVKNGYFDYDSEV